jgi:hypothetical protein
LAATTGIKKQQSGTDITISVQFAPEAKFHIPFRKHIKMFLILGFYILLRVLYQGYWKNSPSQQLFKVFIYIYFAATCFGACWPSSGGIHNYFREVTSLQRIRSKKKQCGRGVYLTTRRPYHNVWKGRIFTPF